ncbi:MAG: hypothetical protein WC700_20780, partial [Gemmatimonadaceae bacterium]
MDVLINNFPTRRVDPDEPGLVAAYTFADGELAQFGRYLNRARSGAGYDLVTRAGTPKIGHGGGIYCVDEAASYRQGACYPHDASNFSHTIQTVMTSVPGAFRLLLTNASQRFYANVDGTIHVSSNAGATFSMTAFPILNRGPVVADLLYDGVNQILAINGRQADADAAVAAAPGALLSCGFHNEHRLVKVYNIRRTVAQARASYVREFARRIVWQWTPRDCGEGPVGGILTGSCSGVGGWTCPNGDAAMKFVWRPDLSHPNGGRLALTNTTLGTMDRIDLEYGSRPFFGSMLVEYQVRDPANDDLIVGFTPMRGVDPTAAGSLSYWLRMRSVAGPWWRSSVYLANGAQIDAADMDAEPVANERCAVLLTRAVDGTIQTYARNSRGWWWSAATGND